MKIHEYQAREILQKAGVPVPPFEVISRADEAPAAFNKLLGHTRPAGQAQSSPHAAEVVVKAQVHAGGRGKAGYVVLCKTAAEAEQHCRRMFAAPMVSKQTGPAGVKVNKILLAPAVTIAREFYVGVVVDRARRTPCVMVSREGGVEIEEVAAKNPDAIVKEWMHPHLGLGEFQVRRLVAALGLDRVGGTGVPPVVGTGRMPVPPEGAKAAHKTIAALARMFIEKDCSLAEINPLVETADGEILAIDAKFNFDDNALFRHPELSALFDPAEENPNEIRAKEHNLSYIALDGNIGCLVNGAGLAMSTMDIIKLHGGMPANFLDVGGSVTRDGAVEAFRIILADPKVRGVLDRSMREVARAHVGVAGAGPVAAVGGAHFEHVPGLEQQPEEALNRVSWRGLTHL